MLLDPDDMIVNPDLFQRLYIYNSNNLDIIEFSVLHQQEGKNEITLLKDTLILIFIILNQK